LINWLIDWLIDKGKKIFKWSDALFSLFYVAFEFKGAGATVTLHCDGSCVRTDSIRKFIPIMGKINLLAVWGVDFDLKKIIN
jgi:hypothetical protein